MEKREDGGIDSFVRPPPIELDLTLISQVVFGGKSIILSKG